MGVETAIGWTDHTYNPWWGCTRVSPGCQNCYAESFAKRTGHAVWGKTNERRFFSDKHWAEPLKWDRTAEAAGKPALVFCASMADVFERRDDLLDERRKLWALIESTPHLIWQLLTKRPENVMDMVPMAWHTVCVGDDYLDPKFHDGWPANVWVGTTVEDQQRANERIPQLLRVPAPVRFLSCEPLLGRVDLTPWLTKAHPRDADELGWIIIGGESGPKHRPMDINDAADLTSQVLAADVPLFFKQWGGRTPSAGGDVIGFRRYKQFPKQARR